MNQRFEANAKKRRQKALLVTFLFIAGLFSMLYFSSVDKSSSLENDTVSKVEEGV